MAQRVKLVEAVLPDLDSAVGKDVIYWDSEVKGFGVRVSPKGKRTWIAQWRFGARQRRMKLGQWPELRADKARKAARDALAAARQGEDPQEAKRKAREQSGNTFGTTVATYLAAYAEKRLAPATLAERRRHLQRDWKRFHRSSIDQIDRRSIAAGLIDIAANCGGIAGNRARASLHHLFNWAMGEGLCEMNPVIGTNLPAEEKSRDRVLKSDEIRQVWAATETAGDYNAIVRLLILTGQRREEIGAMRWS